MLTPTALLIQATLRKYKLRKFIEMGYCPDCCSNFNIKQEREVRIEEDIFGNTYCGKCGVLLGIRYKPRNKKEQMKWLKN